MTKKPQHLPYKPLERLTDDLSHHLLEKFPADNGRNYDAEDLKYIFSTICSRLFRASPSYNNYTRILGNLEAVKAEFIEKRVENIIGKV